MKFIYVTLLCIFAHLVLPAQSNKFTVTLNPFSFAERDGGFTPGIGYNFNNRLAVYSDLGIIFFSPGNYTGGLVETDKSLGFKVKPAVRFYVNDRVVQRGSFLELEGLYKHVKYNATEEIDVADNNGNPAYTYIGGYTIKKDVYGLSIKYGTRLFLDKTKRFGLDLYIGLGKRTKEFVTSGLPAGLQSDEDPFSEARPFSFFWRRGNTVSMPTGAKLFYNF